MARRPTRPASAVKLPNPWWLFSTIIFGRLKSQEATRFPERLPMSDRDNPEPRDRSLSHEKLPGLEVCVAFLWPSPGRKISWPWQLHSFRPGCVRRLLTVPPRRGSLPSDPAEVSAWRVQYLRLIGFPYIELRCGVICAGKSVLLQQSNDGPLVSTMGSFARRR